MSFKKEFPFFIFFPLLFSACFFSMADSQLPQYSFSNESEELLGKENKSEDLEEFEHHLNSNEVTILDVKSGRTDYEITQDQLFERYPYALMSYLSEAEAIAIDSSEDQSKSLFMIFRLVYLTSIGIQLLSDPLDMPEKWREHFVNAREKVTKPSQTSQQITNQISIPNSPIKVRVFKQIKEGTQSENRIILALSGAKESEPLRCMVTEAKSTPGKSPDRCNLLARRYLQKITELVESFKELYPDYILEVTGYSYSGAIAQAAMFASDAIERAYIFNSYGIHPSWIEKSSEEKLEKIYHSYIEGSFLYGQDSNLVSRYSRWKLPKNKVVVPGMKIPSNGLEWHIRQIYNLNHHDSWLNRLYNILTNTWILHSPESVLRLFEVHLNFDFPW